MTHSTTPSVQLRMRYVAVLLGAIYTGIAAAFTPFMSDSMFQTYWWVAIPSVGIFGFLLTVVTYLASKRRLNSMGVVW